MKLIKTLLISATADGEGTVIAVSAEGQFPVTVGTVVTMIGFEGFDESRLKSLHDYLVDRPSLMNDKEVKEGVRALKTILDL